MDKREYTAPKLEDFGTVADLTEAGMTRPGSDAFAGSVNAPGLGMMGSPGMGMMG